jgi:WD domain, G-beta repeat
MASFHPTVPNIIVSTSLDQTIRVWGNTQYLDVAQPSRGGSTVGQQRGNIFATGNSSCKYVMKGHKDGVNWACFHPNLPLLASAANDRQVKIWRMSGTKAREVPYNDEDGNPVFIHENNVICCVFHPTSDVIVSIGDDQAIRVWDLEWPLRPVVATTTGTLCHQDGRHQFSSLAVCHGQNLFAAGHDSGFLLFRIDKVDRTIGGQNGNRVVSCVMPPLDSTPIEQDMESPNERENREEYQGRIVLQVQSQKQVAKRKCVLLLVWIIAYFVGLLYLPPLNVVLIFAGGVGLLCWPRKGCDCRTLLRGNAMEGNDEKLPFLLASDGGQAENGMEMV